MIASVKLYAYGAALAALIALLAFAHHSIYASGKKAGEADGQKIAAKARLDQHRAETARDDLASALTIANEAVADQKKAADAQQANATQAVAAAQANAKDADRTLAAWMAKYANTARNPACAKTLQEALCADVSDY